MVHGKPGRLNKISLNSQEGMVFLCLIQIIRLESDASYTTFFLLNQERHVVSRPMRDFEELLPNLISRISSTFLSSKKGQFQPEG